MLEGSNYCLVKHKGEIMPQPIFQSFHEFNVSFPKQIQVKSKNSIKNLLNKKIALDLSHQKLVNQLIVNQKLNHQPIQNGRIKQLSGDYD